MKRRPLPGIVAPVVGPLPDEDSRHPVKQCAVCHGALFDGDEVLVLASGLYAGDTVHADMRECIRSLVVTIEAVDGDGYHKEDR